jgi:hypothetical protein
MIGFIVPITPKEYSKDWHLANLLLERTVRSICNQTSRDFKLIIVYTDKPEIRFIDDNIHYIPYPFPEISISQIEDFDFMSQWFTVEYAERMMDKSRKITCGCKVAKELGCEYLMAIDSDDMISNKIADFVNENSTSNLAGWRVWNGYLYKESSRFVVKNTQIWAMNGSTHILRADLVAIPDFETDFKLFSYNVFQQHPYTYQRIIDFHNEKLLDLPFSGTVYLIHANNYSQVGKILSANKIKQFIKLLLRGKFLNKKIKQEFGIYHLDSN